MSTWYEDRNFRIVLAIVIVVAATAIVATSGDSVAVHWVTALVSLDVAARLALPRRTS
jgi:hypothetical protein